MNILMVCLGNICRSPMAEGVMRHKIKEYDLNANVDSCGTADYHISQSPDKRGIQTLLKYGIDISQHRGQQFKVADFDTFDLIFAMDTKNYSDIVAKARSQEDIKKVKLLLDETHHDLQKIVPDPYYGSLVDFEETYLLIDNACEQLAKRLSL
ncbi:MAG: low molecular weight phosphotyrosine protein phosphatase [Bacteroidales bacterium]|nr:low molecular weight phosphotyrosine protein phosphatase [Bacteroidales bacterium]